ncbi:MAG: aminoacyltransferase [Prevotellaceae bacterium]|jgi:lipid II:glycine glycyltransferase (peptidoglycan interpeptide bridge formation enzyme)|nr:aminoacyltransferase [Prevotellaceae bacterium]
MIALLKNSEIEAKQWENLIKISPVSSFFQTKECYDFYCSLSFLEPFAFGVSENDNLVGLICGYVVADGGKVKRFFSRRAIIHSGALLAQDISAEALSKLLQFTIKNLEKKAIYIEFRNYFDYSCNKNIFTKNGFNYQPHLNFHIATENIEFANKNLSSTKRRDIKISQTQGAEIVEIKNDEVKDFYKLLSFLYKTKVKTPLFPYQFFEKIAKMPECKIFGIKYNEQIIGGSVCVLHKNKTVYEWFACGLDGKFKNVYSSTLATWAGIEYAATHNFSRLDMMGAGKPNTKYGTRDFKAKFGGELVEHGRFLYISNRFLYKIGELYVKLIKLL